MSVDLGRLREAEDADAPALAALVGGVYAEYPGCVLDLPGVDHDLSAIRSHLAGLGGRLWVLPDEDGLVACVGYAPPQDGGARFELKRLYVRADARRSGIGSALTRMVTEVASTLQGEEVELWSDSRFADAHRHYERHGWSRQSETRDLHDPSNTTEFHFVRAIEPAPPTVGVAWRGADGTDQHAALFTHPLTEHIRGAAEDGTWRYAVSTDHGGFTRHVVADASTTSVVMTSDGLGRWWRDGVRDRALDGCTDVDLEITPATNTLPIRRATGAGARELAVEVAWVRWPSLSVERASQRYVRTADDLWRYESGRTSHLLEVDGAGLVRRYGDGVFVSRT
jgi:putative acetyltransferase